MDSTVCRKYLILVLLIPILSMMTASVTDSYAKSSNHGNNRNHDNANHDNDGNKNHDNHEHSENVQGHDNDERRHNKENQHDNDEYDNQYGEGFKGKVRAVQNGNSLSTDTREVGLLGINIDCVGGIEEDAHADVMTCYLVPDGVPMPDYKADSSVVLQTTSTTIACPKGAGFGHSFQCFITTFDSVLFGPGHWRFVAEFYKDGHKIELKGHEGGAGSELHTSDEEEDENVAEFIVHSFFVLPESLIGSIALVGSSLLGLGGYMFWSKWKKQS